MMEMMTRLADCIGKVYPVIKDNIHNDVELIMFVGTIIDFWTAENGMDVEQSKEIVKTLYEVHADVNDTIGMAKTKE